MEAGNFELARRLAHAFKGGAGTVGLVRLQAAAKELEAILAVALQGKTDAAIQAQQLAALQDAWTQAQQTLNARLGSPALTAPAPVVAA